MIFLSFDIEEFDNPFPCTQRLSFEEQMAISKDGTIKILDLLAQMQVKATFFCTAVFAINAPDVFARMVNEGHEIASHSYYHNRFETSDLLKSREVLEQLSGRKVVGFRMPNMFDVDKDELIKAGYSYDSSLNPTFLPGKYNNLDKPRRIFNDEGIVQIPASVSPFFRIPLFWLSLHNFPLWFYNYLSSQTIQRDGYLNIYFHPWEFVDLNTKETDLPFIVTRNSGSTLIDRLKGFITHFQHKGISFGLLQDCAGQFLEL